MIHDYPPITGGGLSIGVQELARQLHDRFRFVVLSSRLADHFADDRRCPPSGNGPMPSGAEVAVPAPRRIARAIAEADIIIVHWTFSFRRFSTLALLAAPFVNKPVACVIHTAPAHCQYNRMRRLPAPLRHALLALARLGFRGCRAVVALGRVHTGSLVQARFKPTHVIPLPVAPTPEHALSFRQRLHNRPAPATIGIVGEMSVLKGADEIPPILRALTPEYAFRIAGRGPLAAQVEVAAEALNQAQRARVALSDRLDPPAMPAFYATIDVLLVLSRTESQCRVALEAMLAGVLVLARSSAGIADLVVDGVTGLLVEPGDPESIRSAVRLIAADPAAADGIRRRAQARAERAFEESLRDWRRFLAELA
jgi:glycosyltransferase involved in cell wall biosynthesis